jgi:uncharacterized membrane protein YbaN (DUF454 family)
MTSILLKLAGLIALCLGILGIFLPLLPTTPFILLASACFVKSSPRLHQWLLSHRIFGPMIENWQTHRAISTKVRHRGSWLMVLTFSFSIWMMPQLYLKIALFLLLIVALILFRRIPVYDPVAHCEENH